MGKTIVEQAEAFPGKPFHIVRNTEKGASQAGAEGPNVPGAQVSYIFIIGGVNKAAIVYDLPSKSIGITNVDYGPVPSVRVNSLGSTEWVDGANGKVMGRLLAKGGLLILDGQHVPAADVGGVTLSVRKVAGVSQLFVKNGAGVEKQLS